MPRGERQQEVAYSTRGLPDAGVRAQRKPATRMRARARVQQRAVPRGTKRLNEKW